MRINRGREADAASEERTDWFTGTVWADPALADAPGVAVTDVFFTPGARTHWHRHTQGQVLLVTHGRGYAQTRSGSVSPLTSGDVVFFEPGEEHWHGAAGETYLLHSAISLGETEWLEEVAEDDYRAAISDG
jgi:quercetin dioxygenase-like cupin family protein